MKTEAAKPAAHAEMKSDRARTDVANGPCQECIKAVQRAMDAEESAARGEVPQQRKRSKIPPYHYLEPSVEVYRQLEADALKMQNELAGAHYLSEEYKQRFGDFIRLFQRLTKIADTEIKGLQIGAMDRKLLGDIDLILDRVDVPLPAVVSFEATPKTMKTTTAEVKLGFNAQKPIASKNGKPPATFKAKAAVTSSATENETNSELPAGFNLAVGRPGLLYVIYQNPRSMEWTLGRGAVYTYYEMTAPMLTNSMWQHRVESGFAKPLNWTGRYEIVQQAESRTTRTAANSSSGSH